MERFKHSKVTKGKRKCLVALSISFTKVSFSFLCICARGAEQGVKQRKVACVTLVDGLFWVAGGREQFMGHVCYLIHANTK